MITTFVYFILVLLYVFFGSYNIIVDRSELLVYSSYLFCAIISTVVPLQSFVSPCSLVYAIVVPFPLICNRSPVSDI